MLFLSWLSVLRCTSCGRSNARRTHPGSIHRPNTNPYTRLEDQSQYGARRSIVLNATGSETCNENLRTTRETRLFFEEVVVSQHAQRIHLGSGGVDMCGHWDRNLSTEVKPWAQLHALLPTPQEETDINSFPLKECKTKPKHARRSLCRRADRSTGFPSCCDSDADAKYTTVEGRNNQQPIIG